MMKSIVEEKLVSFKELEQKIFKYICGLGQEITQTMLESYDEELAASRDTKQYRDKGKRKTMELWITLFTAHGKAKVQLSHVLQTELPTIPKDSQLYTLPTMPTATESHTSHISFLIDK